MTDFLVSFGVMSLVMAAVTLILLTLRKPMRKRFTAGCRYIVWAVVIIRLCIPVGLGFMPKLITIPITQSTPSAVTVPTENTVTLLPDVQVQTPSDTAASGTLTDPEPVKTTPEPQAEMPVSDPTPAFELTEDTAVKGILLIWLTGAVAFISVTLIKYIVNIKKLKADLAEPSAELGGIYLSVCADMGLTRYPRLYINKAGSSPMVCGFLKPRVLLPEIELAEEELGYIIRHELIHYKRGDLWFKLLSMLANALHWFNPAVYMASAVFADETELSCDETVLGRTELKKRLDYGASMLEIVKHCRTAPGLTTGFNPRKRAVKERFENIIDTAKKRKGVLIVLSVLLIALIATSVIGCTDRRRYDSVPSIEEAMGLPDEEFRQYVFENKVFPVYAEDDEWKLFYDDGKLVLAHSDGRCYEYGEDELEYPYLHENAYYSADMKIFGDKGVLYYSVPPSDQGYGRACFECIDLDSGKISESYTIDALGIVELHGGNAHDLSPFSEKWEGEYYFESGVDANSDSGISSVYLDMITPLGDIYSTILDMDSGWIAEETGYELGRYTDDIGYLKELKDVDTENCDLTKSFIDHTVTTDEAAVLFDEISYAGYDTLVFGDYLLYTYTDGTVGLDIEVTDSEYEYIPAGKHSFQIYGGEYIRHICSSCETEPPVDMNALEAERTESGIFHVYKDTWRGESAVWTLKHEDGALVMSHADGRSYKYAEGLYDHEKYTGARGYDYGRYGGVMYWTAPEAEGEPAGIHFIAIDLSDGSILYTYDPALEEILALHEVDSVYLDTAQEVYFMGYMYADDTTVVCDVTLAAGDDIEFETVKRYDPVSGELYDAEIVESPEETVIYADEEVIYTESEVEE